MQAVTRERAKGNRVACPWLIRKWVDPEAEFLAKYDLGSDPPLVRLGKIRGGADMDNTLWQQPEGAGLEAIAEGFRPLGFPDDHTLNQPEWLAYNALYAYCHEMIRQGRPNGAFKGE